MTPCEAFAFARRYWKLDGNVDPGHAAQAASATQLPDDKNITFLIGQDAQPPLPAEDLRALGWLTPAAFGPVARDVVVRDILDPLATIGIVLSAEERAGLLA